MEKEKTQTTENGKLSQELEILFENSLKNLYKTEEKENKEIVTKEKKVEESKIFLKHVKCPCCDKEIEVRTLKSNKIRLKKQEINLRNIYENIDAYRYELIWCNNCGYVTLNSFLRPLASVQVNFIKKNISDNYKPMKFQDELEISFEEARKGYKLALLNAVVKKAKSLEKTYILLKYSYIIDYYLENEQVTEDKRKELLLEKNEIYKQCFLGLLDTLEKEVLSDKISITMSYLIPYIGVYLLKNYPSIEKEIPNIVTNISTMISKLIVYRTCPTILKNNLEIIKEEFIKTIKERTTK